MACLTRMCLQSTREIRFRVLRLLMTSNWIFNWIMASTRSRMSSSKSSMLTHQKEIRWKRSLLVIKTWFTMIWLLTLTSLFTGGRWKFKRLGFPDQPIFWKWPRGMASDSASLRMALRSRDTGRTTSQMGKAHSLTLTEMYTKAHLKRVLWREKVSTNTAQTRRFTEAISKMIRGAATVCLFLKMGQFS